MPKSKAFLGAALRLAASLAAVGGIAFFDFHVLHSNSATAAFSFLLIILALAARAGLRESITASFASVLAYNYFFLPPIRTLTISDPQNWVALFVFLITAITASHLSSSARRKADEAAARELELQRLYGFSRGLILRDPELRLVTQISQQLVELFEVENVWFHDLSTGVIYKAAASASPLSDDDLRQVTLTGRIWRGADRLALAVPVGLGGRKLGALAVSGPNTPSEVALQAIAQLVAIAMERGRAQEVANRIDAERQNEQLKSTLLDALAHEFKTPLTSVKAATSALLSRRNLDATTSELLTIVDEEADRLTNLVSDSIELARIGTGPVTLSREPCVVEALISSSVKQLRGLFEGRDVDLTIEPDLPAVHADRKLTELVLRQLLNNALKYSPASTSIQLFTELDGDFVAVRVRDEGPGVSETEQQLLFDKFYRSHETRGRVPGTGMGLAIAREIVEAQGGRIWIESAPGKGSQFTFTIPIAPALDADEAREKTALA
jgi:two-component system sensor histidine kinase KdpD